MECHSAVEIQYTALLHRAIAEVTTLPDMPRTRRHQLDIRCIRLSSRADLAEVHHVAQRQSLSLIPFKQQDTGDK
eukprot:293893-Amphidinium_carterae.2